MKKSNRINLITIASLLLLFATFNACGRNFDSANSESPGLLVEDQLASNVSYELSKADDGSSVSRQDKIPAITTRKWIKNGQIKITSEDCKKTQSEVKSIIANLGGEIAGENSRIEENYSVYEFTFSLSPKQYDEAIEILSEKIEGITSLKSDRTEVTAAIADLEARIKVQKELEIRFTEMLKLTGKMDEAIRVTNEIARVRSDIERMEAQLRVTNEQVAHSTLNVTIRDDHGPSEPGFASNAADAAGTSWEYFLDFVVDLIYLWPFAILAFLFFAGRKIWLLRRMRMKTA